MKKIILLLAVLCAASVTHAAVSVKYTLRFEEPQTHYVKVRMEISGLNSQECTLKMPVWTPGSYLVREFSRFVEQFSAKDGSGKPLVSKKTAKNAWLITGKANQLVVEYYVYAYELSVRTSFIDEDHAYLNGPSIFMYVEGNADVRSVVEVIPFQKWKTISVALDRVDQKDPWRVVAPNYDELIDSPFEIGNHPVFSFKAAGINHDVAIFGSTTYDSLKIKEDFTKIIEKETSIFGENPCKSFLFIIHILNSGSGGLEHMNSTTMQVSRSVLATPSGYHNFVSLAAHEYFHVWNVKRLRPYSLGPFDYDKENNTGLLFFSEGFTAYYDEHIMVRCKLVTEEAYLKTLATTITGLENTPGNKIHSLYESGLDAWIKYYRGTENSNNSNVSYYIKGSVVGALLDIKILDATDGKTGLDGVMKYMYDEYYKKQGRGFKDDELVNAIEKVCNCSMDDFFEKYIYKTESLPYEEIMAMAGLKTSVTKETATYLGVSINATANKITVSGVERNSPAWKYGLNVNDEIIAIDDFRITEDPVKYIATKKPGDKLVFEVVRGGLLRTIEVVLSTSPKVNYQFEKMEKTTEKQERVYKKWMDL